MPAAPEPTAHPARTTADPATPPADPPTPPSFGSRTRARPARPATAAPQSRAPERWTDPATARHPPRTAAGAPQRPVRTGSAPPAPLGTVRDVPQTPDPAPHSALHAGVRSTHPGTRASARKGHAVQ